MIKIGRSIPEDSLLNVSTVPVPLRKKAKTSFCSSLVTSLPSIIWTELEVENKLMAKL